MSDALVGEIRLFCGDFPPVNWAFCDGSLLKTDEYQDLFKVIGDTYGGNYFEFALPDLRGRAPMNQGAGPNLTPRSIGERGGSATAYINDKEFPKHTHRLRAVSDNSNVKKTENNSLAQAFKVRGSHVITVEAYATSHNDKDILSPDTLSSEGESKSYRHQNMQPYLPLNFIIALKGVYPERPRP